MRFALTLPEFRVDSRSAESYPQHGMSAKMPANEMKSRAAKFRIGQVVRHRFYPFRGVIFDVDPTFSNTEEWWEAIPEEIRPTKDQPFYHLLAENDDTEYVAYVSEQNLLADASGEPIQHPQIDELFANLANGCYTPRNAVVH